jgi:hypothetical protein
MSVAAIKNKARLALHAKFAEPANYYESRAASPVLVSVRPQSKAGETGDLAGTRLHYAKTMDRVETVIFLASEVPHPARNSVVVLSATEAYQIDTVEPPDGITVTTMVVRMDESDIVGLVAPGGV